MRSISPFILEKAESCGEEFPNIFGNGDPRSAELTVNSYCKYLAERLLRYVECGAWILSFINQYVQSLNMSPP